MPNTEVTPPEGLSPAEAARRLSEEGLNEIADPGRRGVGRLVLEIVSEPMIALLVALVVLYVVLGEARDAVAMGVSVLMIIGLAL
ncbi:MAG: hypothetical protein J0L92_40325, partial [Deltaproteobacteria bacterium]|nr:hypothetical protein [Deltaproteobacteria bacterium]